ELVTNAVKTTQTAPPDNDPAWVSLRLSFAGTRLLLEVSDHDTTPPVLQVPEPTAVDGRGLLLVDNLCPRWGYFFFRTAGTSTGKVVWAELDASAPVHVPSDGTPATDFPTRQPTHGPTFPTLFESDVQLLRRVADGLRGLDDWRQDGTDSRRARQARNPR
nr:ATP-binding protein [Micromonospora sp. DSM 115978]